METELIKDVLIILISSILVVYLPYWIKSFLENRPSKTLKVKLLRKVRKRFQIIYNKEGHYLWDIQFTDQFFLIDNYNSFNSNLYPTKNDCLERILKILRDEHSDKGKRNRIRNRNKKIWYGN